MIAKLLKPVLSVYIRGTDFYRELYMETLTEYMTSKAKAERDRVVAEREAKYQADKAEREKAKESGSEV